MRTYTWQFEGQEKKLEIYSSFLRIENEAFFDVGYSLIHISPENVMHFKDKFEDSAKFKIQFDTADRAKEALDLILHEWYEDEFYDEDVENDRPLTASQYSAIRTAVHDEIGQMGEEARLAIRGACANTCGRVADFGKFVLSKTFNVLTQIGVGAMEGVRVWWNPESALRPSEQEREHEE